MMPYDEPAIDRFLSFLADNMQRRPEALAPLSLRLASRLARLTEGLALDYDDPIEGDVDL